MSLVTPRAVLVQPNRTAYSLSRLCSARQRVRVCVSAPDAGSTSAQQSDKAGPTGDEARRRNEDALSRVLGDFAIAKATGKLEIDDEDDEDELLDGVEGEDWVWWRADDTDTSVTASTSTATSGTGHTAVPVTPSTITPPSEPYNPSEPARRPPRASLLRSPAASAGSPPAASKFVRKAPAPSQHPPPSSQSRAEGPFGL